MGGDRGPLHTLFHPRSIAVVGVSPRGGYGLKTIENLDEIGFPGPIFPINPRRSEIAGRTAFPSLDALPELPDAVAVAVPAAATLDVVREAGALGIPAGVVYAAGFAELGEDGRRLQGELAALCAAANFQVVGPNCLGVVSYAARTALWGITMGRVQTEGHVAVVSQSGNIVLNLMMHRQGLRLSHAVSYGNGAVLDLADFIAYLSGEPEVRVIGIIVEGLSDVARFAAAADAAQDRGIHIVALRIGRSERGRRAAIAHTGKLTGDDSLYNALFHDAGVIRCDDIQEMVETLKLLSADRVPRGNRLGVFASSGGECGLVSDLAEDLGLALPDVPPAIGDLLTPLVPTPVVAANPLDITASGWANREVYRLAATSLAAMPEVDAVLCIGDAAGGSVPMEELGWIPMAQGLGDAVRATDKPVLNVATISDTREDLVELLAAEHVPCLVGLTPALRAVAHAARAAKFQPRRDEPPLLPAAAAQERQARARAVLGHAHMGETAGKELLALYGIRVPRGGFAATPDEAVALAGEAGYPVVLKVEAAGIDHKSDIGGVILDLRDASQVREAAEELQARLQASLVLTRPPGLRVEAMARGVAELILGGGNDPTFGPYVMVGLGGVAAEVLRDVTHRLAPVGRSDARDMLAELRGRRLLEGFRGLPADREAAAEVIARTSELLAELPEIAALDINPLLVGREGEGCIALDVLIVTAAGPESLQSGRAREDERAVAL